MITLILGLQWGDEGKGKIVDMLSKSVRYVVRFHGGNNAGHTVIVNGKKYPFHLLPSGVLHKQVTGVIGNGVILDLEVLLNEIKTLEEEKIMNIHKLAVSPRCHLIMPYHKALDEAYENARGTNKLGTTKRGIGPCYADKVSYNGIRIYELLHWDSFVEKFTFQCRIKNKILNTFGVKPVSIKQELKKFSVYRRKIEPYVRDTFEIIHSAFLKKEHIIFEGAHGVMLDNDHSPYPYATGSNVVAGAVNVGSGLPPHATNKTVGVVKAYLTRVGGGPLPTEFDDMTAHDIREKGGEYGTTTGRPRRIGWLDLEAVRFGCLINNVTELAITKLDILSGLKQIKICTGYQLNAKPTHYSACGYKELSRLTTVYKTFEGWAEDISKIRQFKQLPLSCKKYISFISSYLQVPVTYIGVGPSREACIKVS